MFSLEQLLFSVASDLRSNIEILDRVLPMINEVYCRERKERDEIKVKHNLIHLFSSNFKFKPLAYLLHHSI